MTRFLANAGVAVLVAILIALALYGLASVLDDVLVLVGRAG